MLFDCRLDELVQHFCVLESDLEETKCHGASERPGKILRTKSTRTNATSGTE